MLRDLRLCLALLAGTALACGGAQNGNNGSQLSVVPCASNLPDGGAATGCPPPSVPADGTSTITLSFKGIAADGSSAYNGVIDITSPAQVLFGDGKVESDALTMVNGSATETVACAAGTNCVGKIVLTASQVSNGANSNVSVTVTFTAVAVPDAGPGDAGSGDAGSGDAGPGDGGLSDGGDAGPPPVPGQIVFSGTSNPYMGVDYGPTGVSQFTENTFTFTVLDVKGTVPIPGASVSFTTQGPGALPGGSFLEPPLTSVLTDQYGNVIVKAHSGQASGVITITATVDKTGIQTNGQGSVVGTQPSVKNSSLICSPQNLPVYLGSQGSYPCEVSSAILQKSVCTANLADRFGNVVTVQVAVKFFSEAGNFEQPSSETLPFSTNTGQTYGAASNTLDTNGSLPEDVDPIENEPSYVDQCAGVPNHTYNPRDGLVTVIAVFQGEEAFTADSTKVYHLGNQFTDLPQPFVDANDNSVWDPSELCPGQSVDGRCGPPNGVWDANTNVFLVAHVLYTGHANGTLATCDDCIVSPFQGTTILFWPPSTLGPIPESGSITGTIEYSDVNLNPPASEATTNVILTGDQSVQLTYPVNPQTCAPFVGDLGMSVIPLQDCADGGTLDDAGLEIEDDAGNPIISSICVPRTAITDFSGGVTGCQYQLTNSNTQDAGAKSWRLTATLDIEANSDSQTYNGQAL